MSRKKQTIIIHKSIAKTRMEAEKIARRYADRIYTSRETKNTYRFRQIPPGLCRGEYKTQIIEKGVAIVWCET